MSGNSELKLLRTKIDQIDDALFDLLHQRSNISIEIGEYKKNKVKEIYDRKREADILGRLQKKCEEKKIDFDYIKSVWEIILNHSHKIQIEGK